MSDKLFKVILLFSAGFIYRLSFTPPNPPPPPKERVKYGGEASDLLMAVRKPWVRKLTTVLTLSFIFAEALTIAVTSWAPHSALASVMESSLLKHASNIRITPQFAVGWLLVVAGGLIRITCFKYLGRQFTFELSLRYKHVLITDGPYSIVRHPSYTGSIMAVGGLFLCLLGPGSWVASVELWNFWLGKVALLFWIANLVFVPAVMVLRVGKEDGILRENFKEEWEKWSRQTPYKLLPGVY